jgi:hypothetical protein
MDDRRQLPRRKIDELYECLSNDLGAVSCCCDAFLVHARTRQFRMSGLYYI